MPVSVTCTYVAFVISLFTVQNLYINPTVISMNLQPLTINKFACLLTFSSFKILNLGNLKMKLALPNSNNMKKQICIRIVHGLKRQRFF